MPGLMHGLVVHRDITAAANTKRVLERRLSPPALTAVGRRRIGIISNARAHRNHLRGAEPKVDPVLAPDVLYRSPRTLPSLSRALLDFAEAQVELLIVCGGDGTVRDVITCASSIFTGRLPRMAVVPAGKTNALALDLGIPVDWTLADALAAAEGGRIEARSPIEVLRPGSVTADLRGFLFGAGAFVRGTGLAQRTHRAGAFSGLAVGLSLGWGVAQTLFGGRDNMWRAGERMRIRTPEGFETERDFYLLLGSTLQRFPLGLKPFGNAGPGLNVLAVDAPPRQMAVAVPALLAGSEAPWLDRLGYHRGAPETFSLTLDGGFILDGELYAGGELTVRRGAPMEFIVP